MNFRCFTSAGQEQPEKYKDEKKSRYKHAKRGERESIQLKAQHSYYRTLYKIVSQMQTNKQTNMGRWIMRKN
jgi:hypothetical protein